MRNPSLLGIPYILNYSFSVNIYVHQIIIFIYNNIHLVCMHMKGYRPWDKIIGLGIRFNLD